ncbi:hypothetical protein JOM56_004433 [Amanita muscaria]
MATTVSSFQEDTQSVASSSATPQPQAGMIQTQVSQQLSGSQANGNEDEREKKKAKRRKVNHACLYCRRSHMTCDEGRPCQRCIKREIGHLCHDERKPKSAQKTVSVPVAIGNSVDLTRPFSAVASYQSPLQNPAPTWPVNVPAQNTNYIYQPETLGNEFSMLTDFLETLDEGTFFTPPTTVTPSLMSSSSYAPGTTPNPASGTISASDPTASAYATVAPVPAMENPPPTLSNEATPASSTSSTPSGDSVAPILPAATKTERFLLTAADQEDGSRDERLNRVIRSKYEAGLLKPYNYAKGYGRLSRWMDRNVSQESKQQILQPISVLRPKFRAIAQSLRDIDLVFIEEAFERLLLDYDRVFSAMGVPACLWRRTGEIYKGNRQFSELVGIDEVMLRDGRLCIYELMAEESAVNYWEKYGNVAFDSTQKAVLTSCVLRYKPVLNLATSPTLVSARLSDAQKQPEDPAEDGLINCCFSFTIRRDKWGIPSMIVGNFIKC